MRSLGLLYGVQTVDSFLFDRELMRISSAFSRIVLAELSEVGKEQQRIASIALEASSEYARELAKNMMTRRPQLEDDLSLVLSSHLLDLAKVGLERGATPSTRRMARQALAEIVPRSLELMPGSRAKELREHLSLLAAASLDVEFQGAIEALVAPIPDEP